MVSAQDLKYEEIEWQDSTLVQPQQKVENTISTQDVIQRLISSPLEVIQGKVPGASFYKRDGDPNGRYSIRIRGLGSVSKQDIPVFLDGRPVFSLSVIDPNEIKSVRIVKDLATLARISPYTTNGAILIDTYAGAAKENTTEQVLNIEYQAFLLLMLTKKLG